jgi:hypothetical protein
MRRPMSSTRTWRLRGAPMRLQASVPAPQPTQPMPPGDPVPGPSPDVVPPEIEDPPPPEVPPPPPLREPPMPPPLPMQSAWRAASP